MGRFRQRRSQYCRHWIKLACNRSPAGRGLDFFQANGAIVRGPDMSQDIVISAEHLGKRYRRGLGPNRHNSIRDTLAAGFDALIRGRRPESAAHDTFWALQDASFDITRGENVGIIGLNGAGKSTLLKILSRITTPTVGGARVTGRLGALLEVGTGFHGELSGRENTFLYGAILGMSRAEVDRKFDAI